MCTDYYSMFPTRGSAFNQPVYNYKEHVIQPGMIAYWDICIESITVQIMMFVCGTNIDTCIKGTLLYKRYSAVCKALTCIQGTNLYTRYSPV